MLVWDALRLKNTIQVVGLVAYNAGLLLYGAVQMSQIKDAVLQLSREDALDSDTWAETKGFLIAIPCIIAFMTCLMVICAWKLYDEFAWTIYKHISADLRMKRRYLTFQVYIALLKFDFFFFLGFTVQFVVIVTVRKAEFACTIAAIPVTIIILLLAAYFCRRESLIGTIPIIVSRETRPIQLRWTNSTAVSLFRRSRLLPLQARADVLREPQRRLSTSSKRAHDFRRSDHPFNPHDDCQLNHVCCQLQQRSQAIYHKPQGGNRRRENGNLSNKHSVRALYNGNAAARQCRESPLGKANAAKDGDRLECNRRAVLSHWKSCFVEILAGVLAGYDEAFQKTWYG